jgi:hypothetical protein
MGLVIKGLENVTATALANLFSDDQNSLDALTTHSFLMVSSSRVHRRMERQIRS